MFVTSLVGDCKIDGSEAARTLGYVTPNARSYVHPLTRALLTSGAANSNCDCDENVCVDRIISKEKMMWGMGFSFHMNSSLGHILEGNVIKILALNVRLQKRLPKLAVSLLLPSPR